MIIKDKENIYQFNCPVTGSNMAKIFRRFFIIRMVKK